MAKKKSLAAAAAENFGQDTKEKKPKKKGSGYVDARRSKKDKAGQPSAGNLLAEWDGDYRKWTFPIRSDQHESLEDLQYQLKKTTGEKFGLASLTRLALDRFFEDIEANRDAIIKQLYELELHEFERNPDRTYSMTSKGREAVKDMQDDEG